MRQGILTTDLIALLGYHHGCLVLLLEIFDRFLDLGSKTETKIRIQIIIAM